MCREHAASIRRGSRLAAGGQDDLRDSREGAYRVQEASASRSPSRGARRDAPASDGWQRCTPFPVHTSSLHGSSGKTAREPHAADRGEAWPVAVYVAAVVATRYEATAEPDL